MNFDKFAPLCVLLYREGVDRLHLPSKPHAHIFCEDFLFVYLISGSRSLHVIEELRFRYKGLYLHECANRALNNSAKLVVQICKAKTFIRARVAAAAIVNKKI